MRQYSVQQTSLTFKWVFKRLIPSLPGPGSPGFPALCRILHPYGLNASGVTVEAPSSRLSELTLSLSLLDNRVALRMTCGFLEMYVSSLITGDEEKLVKILELSFPTLSEIDSEVGEGEAQVRVATHLKLPPLENFTLLHEHLIGPASNAKLIPEAAVYKIDVEDASRTKELRVVIAKSIAFEDALFVEVNSIYDGPLAISDLAKRVEADLESVIGILGLEEGPEGV